MRYEDMEYLNFKNIIDSIDELDNPTRALIAKKLELSRTTVSNVVNVLIEEKIAIETEVEKPTRGRPGLKLGFSPDKWYALGAAFTSDSWTFVIVDLNGKICDKYKTPSLSQLTQEGIISTLLAGLRFMICRVKGYLLPSIGLGLPGIVDSEKGEILFANDLGWHNPINVSEIVEKELGYKVYCINRYTTSGLAEYKYANVDKEKNMVFIGLGSGIRSAIFINGNLLTGPNYTAGRIAHLVIDPKGPLCDCGKRGCLLALANDKALIQNALRIKKEKQYSKSILFTIPDRDITVSSITELADDGDECARVAIDTIASPIANGLSTLVDIINPRKIVLGGPIGYNSKYLVGRIQELLSSFSFYSQYKGLKIEQGKLKDIGSALGAATLVLQNKAELLYKWYTNNKNK